MEQVRMPISELETFLAEKVKFNITRRGWDIIPNKIASK